MEILLGALAEAILGAVFGILFEDAANRPRIRAWRERIQGPSKEKQALERVLNSAYRQFNQDFLGLTNSFFDEHFLTQDVVVAELAKLLTPTRQPDITVIERAWRAQLPGTTYSIQQPIQTFVDALEIAIGDQPDLFPFTDSRALQQMLQLLEKEVDYSEQSLTFLEQIARNTRRPELEKVHKEKPELVLKLYKMERDQGRYDEISFETHRALPQHHQFGLALENVIKLTMARGIQIRVEFSWRGHDISKTPSFKAPRRPGWSTQVSQLKCEHPAVLTFRDPKLSCFYGQPIEWDNTRLTGPLAKILSFSKAQPKEAARCGSLYKVANEYGEKTTKTSRENDRSRSAN